MGIKIVGLWFFDSLAIKPQIIAFGKVAYLLSILHYSLVNSGWR